jgi:hypothetical protein
MTPEEITRCARLLSNVLPLCRSNATARVLPMQPARNKKGLHHVVVIPHFLDAEDRS